MAPTDSARDRDNLKKAEDSNETENPFVRFRRFADAQIGAVLQGIIGLPSVVLKKEGHDANRRWGDLERREERRRKEATEGNGDGNGNGNGEHGGVVDEDEEKEMEIPVRKFSGRPGMEERGKSGEVTMEEEEEEIELTVKKFLGWPLPSSTQSQSSKPSTTAREGGQRDDIDLYSPITKALFAPHNHYVGTETDWSKIPNTIEVYDYNRRGFFDLNSKQKWGSALNMMQSLVYNELTYAALIKSNSSFYGWNGNSLLPYILFSSYSPLALSNKVPLPRAEKLEGTEDFPWCAAFEDLLLSSRGRPMGLWMHVSRDPVRNIVETMPGYGPSGSRPVPEYILREEDNLASPELKDEIRKARLGMDWIDRMDMYGLLSPGPTSIWDLLEENWPRPWYTKLITEEPPKRITSAQSKDEDEHLSELDMYDEFVNYIASGDENGPFTSSDIEDILDRSHLLTLDRIRTMGRDTEPLFSRSIPSDSIRLVWDFDFGAFLRGEPSWGKTSTGTSRPVILPVEQSKPAPSSSSTSRSTQTEETPNPDQAQTKEPRPHNEHKSLLEQLIEDALSLATPNSPSISKSTSTSTSTRKTSPDTANDEDRDRVVSQTTTTEQTTTGSGTVETVVTIEKVFADGRKYVTVTEHVEVPSQSSTNGGEVEEIEHEEEWAARTAKEQGNNEKEVEDENSDGKKKKVHKGWFWH